MLVKVRCLHKNRNHNGVIQSYILQDQNGQQIEVKRPQLLELLQNPNYDFIDLKLSADGKIIDKTEQPQELPTFGSEVYAASFFRNGYDRAGKGKEQLKSEMKQCLQNEIATGKIDASKLGCLSDSLELVGIVRAMTPEAIAGMVKHMSPGLKNTFVKLTGGTISNHELNKAITDYLNNDCTRGVLVNLTSFPLVGYRLKNVGAKPIVYKCINTFTGEEGEGVIQAGETKALTRVETVNLLISPDFSFKIKNAKVFMSSNSKYENTDKYGRFKQFYLAVVNRVPGDLPSILWIELPEQDQPRFYEMTQQEFKKHFSKALGINPNRMSISTKPDQSDKNNLYKSSDSLELVGIVRAMKTGMIKDLFNCISEKDRFIILNSGGIVEDRVINDALNKGCELYAKKYTEVVDLASFMTSVGYFPVVGYQLKNVGSEPIEYKVVDTNSGKEALSVIQPGEVKALTKVETAMLLSEARFNFKIRNARVCQSSMNTTHIKGKYEDLATYYLSYIKGLPNPEKYSAYDIFWLALPESEQHRFYNIGLAEIRGIVGTGAGTNSAVSAKNNSKSKPNIFNMFKK